LVTKEATTSYVSIKHDVEASPAKSLILAEIEAKYGISATYYFHGFFARDTKSIEIIKKIQNLGHEVGYHYDVLDSNDGDFGAATLEFDADIIDFTKAGVTIKTVCPHGNPLKQRNGWDSNKDYFKNTTVRNANPGIFDVVNDFSKLPVEHYLSDAGFNLKVIDNIRDNDKGGLEKDLVVNIDWICSTLTEGKSLILSVHPHRLEGSKLQLALRVNFFKIAKSIAVLLIKSKFLKKLISKLFKLSKIF